MMIDLRSDTVTRPCPAMRQRMAEAEVGDDVYQEDPTVRALEATAAEQIGFEAALFVPTGTMGNQIAVHLHTSPGDDVLLEGGSHIYKYELGALAAWSGVVPRVLEGENGVLDPETVRDAIAPDVYYMARPTLLTLENSGNHAGGTVISVERTAQLQAVARENGLKTHLDGARIFNAAASLGVAARELANGFDTVMFCLSKGLGAPVGSMLCADEQLITRGRVIRKRMGGGMRQSGILAAAGLFALEQNLGRLEEDHRRARAIAAALAERPEFSIDPAAVETNIVVAEVNPPSADGLLLEELRNREILAIGMGHGRIRFVTHLDFDDAMLDRTLEVIRSLPSVQ
jgi:threonine aldolase